MIQNHVTQMNDDPRKLNRILERATELARVHSVGSVVVGLAAPEGDLLFPEFVNFVQASLRVEDQIYRMTRERAVLHLADIELVHGQMVLERLVDGFRDEFPALDPLNFETRFFNVAPGTATLKVKDVLTQIFGQRSVH